MTEQFISGVTDNTPTRLQLDAGVLLSSFDPTSGTVVASNIIGATRGGGSFSAVPTIHNVAADGAPTNMKGMDRIDEWVVNLNTTLLEFTPDTIGIAMGVAPTTSTSGSFTKYIYKNAFAATDYKDFWWVGALSSGGKVAIHIKNGVNKSGLTLTVADKGEGTFPITIVGNYDTTLLADGTAPFELYYPTPVTSGTNL